MFYTSIYLFQFVQEALSLIQKRTSSNTQPGHPEALKAIIFAVISLEVFSNELLELIERRVTRYEPPSELIQIAKDRKDIEWGRFLDKFRKVKHSLTGEKFEEGKSTFQNLKALIEVRNAIVHMTPSEEIGIKNGRVAVIEQDRILAKIPSYKKIIAVLDDSIPWYQHLETLGCARWAHNTACDIVSDIKFGIRDDHIRFQVDHYFSNSFLPT